MKEVHDDKDKITGRAMTYSHYCDKKWDSGEGAAQHPDFGSGGNAHAIPETATAAVKTQRNKERRAFEADLRCGYTPGAASSRRSATSEMVCTGTLTWTFSSSVTASTYTLPP